MALTQQTVPSKLRHLQSFVSSGNFYPPAGTTIVYVAVLGATAGGTTQSDFRYASPGATGTTPTYGAYVQVNPQAPHVVTIGAAGAIGTSGGSTSFDGAITVNSGAPGSNGAGWTNGAAGSAGSVTAITSLPALNPSNNTLVRVSGGGAGSNISGGGNRAAGISGVVHIYGY